MRSQEQIIELYNKLKENDFLGFQGEVLLPYLDFEHAKPLLKQETTEMDWNFTPYTEATVLKDMREYMEFAWGKVRDHRGISASRSVEKMEAWLRVLGDDELAEEVAKDSNYPQYGAPALKLVCDKYGLPVPEDDRILNMIQGHPCYEGCDEGCGLE